MRSFFIRLFSGIEAGLGGIFTGGVRSVLTVLGVLIGVASVLSLLAIGLGTRQAIADQYSSLGTNVITVQSHTNAVQLTTSTASTVQQLATGITAVMPVVGVNAPVSWRYGEASGLGVLGVTPALLQIRQGRLLAGSFISDLEETNDLYVAVLGYNAYQNLFGVVDPIGQDVYIGNASFRVIGVLAPLASSGLGPGVTALGAPSTSSSSSSSSSSSPSGTGASGTSSNTASNTVATGEGIDSDILIPASTAQLLVTTNQVSSIWIKAASRAMVTPVVEQVQRILATLFHLQSDGQVAGSSPAGLKPFVGLPLRPGGTSSSPTLVSGGTTGNQAVSVTSLNALVTQADAANRILTLMLTAIAAVALLVGGLGVMNIMLVAVRERTVEIGLRKALGALEEELLFQFVVEALLLSVIGGFLGWIVGYLGIGLVHRYGVAAVAIPGALWVALAASAAVGVVFGAYPAYLASQLEPVEALQRQ